MFKKIGMVTAMSTALIVGGGAFASTVGASANTDNPSQQQHQSYNFNSFSNSDGNFNDFWQNYFANYQVNWNDQQAEPVKNNQLQEETKEQPTQKQEAPKQTEQKQAAPAKAETTATQAKPVQEKQQQQSQAQSSQLNAYEQEVVELTNNERVDRGLEPLQIDATLSKMAREKSRDMSANNYFAHTSPNYGSPFDMMASWGITYSHAAENIARGQRTPEEVVNGWMNSEGHRANILNPDFTEIGVGYVENGNYWTQEFTG